MEEIKVLIVEDDPMVASINCKLTAQVNGFVVIGVASSYDEAWEKIQRNRPDLVLLDVYLPSGSGVELLRRIREENLAADVILVTAAQEAETVVRLIRLGAVDYLIKPFDLTRLRKALENYRRLRTLVRQKHSFTQKDLDALIPGEIPQHQLPTYPKGVQAATMERVLDVFLRRNGSLSAAEVGAELGVSRTTAWRYLEYLAAAGKLAVELEYGAAGRPIKKYRL